MSTDDVRLARVRTFQPRRGRVSDRHEDALARLLPVYGVDESFEPAAAFGRTAPLVLEIGSGMGTATAEMAAADPGRDYLAVEVHPPGIANLLWLVDDGGLRNVRVFDGDALDLARTTLAPSSLSAIHVYFPDPWPKPRHHKRRIIAPDHVALLRSRLAPGGVIHCATDWAAYADRMLEVLSADPELVNTSDGFTPRPAHRPVTKFERRGVAAGREIFDLVFERRGQGRSHPAVFEYDS
ncbi:MAG TPA: tRNA (guanosine(46)-N7)-methyltransferase TrmB [Phytomonospora sp.]